jgi:uncharacterized protein
LNFLHLELILINLFYTGLVIVNVILLTSLDYLKKPSQIQILGITFIILFIITCFNIAIFSINLKFEIMNLVNLIPYIVTGILLSFVSEVLISFLLRKIIKYKNTNISLTQQYEKHTLFKKIVFHLIIIGISSLEEIIFRGFVLQYLLILEFPLIIALSISSIGFGINHFFRNPTVVIQKSVSGLIFGILAYVSNFSLLVPIISHIGENYLIMLLQYFQLFPSQKVNKNDH